MAIDFSYSPQEASDSEVDFSYSPEAVKPKKQNKGIVADLATDLKRGVQSIPNAITGLADIPVAAVTGSPLISAAAEGLGKMTGFQPGQWAKDAEQEYSEGRKQARQNIDAAWKDGTAGDIASAYLQNPSQIAGSIVESLPSMLAGGLAGRAALGIGGRAVSAGAGGVGPVLPGAIARTVGEKLAPAVGAGLGEGAVMAGQAMDNLTEQGVDPRTAAGYAAGTGIVGAALGAGGGKVAQMLGVVDPETAIAGGAARAIREGANASKWQVAKETGKNIIGGGISEGIFEELPQSVMEQGLSNLAQGKPIGEGVARAGVEGALAGFGMGAGFNAIPARQEPQGPLSRTVEAGKQSGAIVDPDAIAAAEQYRQRGDVIPAGSFGQMNEFANFLNDEKTDLAGRREAVRDTIPFQKADIPSPLSLVDEAKRQEGGIPFEGSKPQAPDWSIQGNGSFANQAELANLIESEKADLNQRRNPKPQNESPSQGDGSFSTMNEFADLLNSERQQVESSRRAIAAKQALRRESDLESADARVADSMAKESEQNRRSVLESVLADPAVQNHAAKFSAELKRQGFRNFTPTESELSSIVRFGDILNAKPETTTEPSLPNEATAEQLGIKERKEPSQAQGSQRDKIAEVQQLVSAGWKVNGRTLVSPTGKKRNLNFAERYAAVKAQQEKRGNATQAKSLAQEATQANDEEARTQPAAAPEAEGLTLNTANSESTVALNEAPKQVGQTPVPTKPRTVKKAGPQNRDDLVGAIISVTGNKGISAGMAQTITGDKAGSGNAKLRGLFTNDGIADLDDTAELLRTEEGYDVRDGNHLAELIREQSAGNAVYSMERTEREAQENAEKQYRDNVRQRAKALGMKVVGRKFDDIEKSVLAAEMQQAQDEAQAERDAIAAAEQVTDESISDLYAGAFDNESWLNDEAISDAKDDIGEDETQSPFDGAGETSTSETAGSNPQRSEEAGFGLATKSERGSVGASLSKAERKSVLKTLVDVYKKNGAPKEFKGIDRNGNERSGYAHSPEYFVRSDITGAMVRYFVTLPDGRIAHPTELFPDYTQSDIDYALQKQLADERAKEEGDKGRLEALKRRIGETLNVANRKYNAANPNRDDTTPAILTNGEAFIRTSPENVANDLRLLGEDWHEQKSDFGLTGQTNSEASAEYKQQQEEANKKDDEPAPNVTADQVDMWNTQGSLIDNNREPSQSQQKTDAAQESAQDKAPAITAENRLDHGELSIPNRTNNINAELDRYKAQQEKDARAKAKTEAEQKREDKAAAKAALAEYGDAIVEKHGDNLGKRELKNELDQMAKWEPKKLLQLVEKFKKENGLDGEPRYSKAKETIKVDGVDRQMTNSNGKPIAQTEEGLRNFWRWFAGSKVVDAEGRPLVVYHGTAKDFTKFDLSKSGESTGNTGFYGAGAYFSEDGEDAGGYALWARKDDDDAANVIPAYLSLKDPLYLHINPKDDARKDKARASLGRIVDQLLSEGYFGKNPDKNEAGSLYARLTAFVDKADFERFMGTLYNELKGGEGVSNLARRAGFDGVMAEGFKRGENFLAEAVAFNPAQIKSATGNNGDFDGANPDIRKSFAGQSAATADTHALATAQQRLNAGEDAETVRKETGWFKGAEGKWKYEISDADARLKAAGETFEDVFNAIKQDRALTVSDVIDHPALFAAYPAIGNLRIRFIPFSEQGRGNIAVYIQNGNPMFGGNRIEVERTTDSATALSAILHEIQHGIQTIEGFASGGNMRSFAKDLPDGSHDNGYGSYRRLAGEVEARNTQARQNMTDAERRATPPSKTADVADSDVIVVFNGKEMASASAPANAQPMQEPMQQSAAEQRIKSLFGDKVARLLIESGIVSFVNRGNAYQGATFENGNIVLNLDALSADNFDGVLLHEGLHSTLRQMVGEETYGKLMKQLESMLKMGKGAQWVADANAAVPDDTKPENVTEEIAAYAVEQVINGGKLPNVLQRWVQNFLSAIRTAIIQHLPSGKLKNWAVMNLKAQDLARLAKAGLKAKAAGMESAQREAMAYSQDGDKEVPYSTVSGHEIDGSDGDTIQRKATNWMRSNLQGKSFKNDEQGWDISIGRKGINKSMMHSAKEVHSRSVAAIPSLLKNAILVSSEENRDPAERINIPTVHHFYAPLRVGGKDYLSRIIVKETKDGQKFYDYETSDEVSPANLAADAHLPKEGAATKNAGLVMSMDKLLSHVKKEHGGTDPKFSKASQAIKSAVGAVTGAENRIVGASNRQYDQAQRQFFKNVGRDVERKNIIGRTLDYLRSDFWKKMAVGVVDQFRGLRDLNDNGQAYLLARLSKGTAGAFDALLNHGKLSLRDGVYDADTSGGFLQRLGITLNGEIDDFLWWTAANRAENLSKQDRENLFTAQDIAAGKSLASGTTDFDYTVQTGPLKGKTTRNRAVIYADANRVFNEFQKNALDMAEQSGLIDGSTRHLWESEFYVPFYRVSDEDGEFVGAKMGNALVRQSAFKKLKGGTDKLNADLLANTLMNWSHLIEASAKNRAAKASLEAAGKMGAAQRVASTMGEYAQSNGSMLPPGTKGAVWYMDGGNKVEYLVSDPFVMTAITSLEYAGMRNAVMDVMSKFKHYLTIGVTANPAFKIRNLIRDSIQAIGTSDLGYNPITNIKEGIRTTKRDSQEYVSALASGGLIRFGTMLENSEADRVRQLIKSGVKDSTILNNESKLRAFYDQYLEPAVAAYNELGNRSEEINRAALYNQLIKQGKSHAEAALLARDLMDFSLQGSFTTIRFLSQVVPFFNARLQGMYKLGRATKDNPAKLATVIGACAVASIALMLGYDDDEDWKRREDFDRDGYFWFKFGGLEWRIPKPFEVGAVASLAERTLEYMINDEMTGERYRKVVSDLVKNNLSMNPVPQVIKPIIDLYANKDSFTGRPIETMNMQRLEPEMRFNSQTSMVARGLSNATAGALSPVQYDHIARAYFGWLGSFAVGMGDMAARAVSDEPEKPTADYFKLGSFGFAKEAGTGSSRYVSMIYDQAKELEQAYATYRQLVKDGKMGEAQEYMEDNKDKLSRYRSTEAVKKAESRLNEQIRLVEKSNLSADEKRERINAINKQKEQVAMRLAPGLN